MFTNWYRWLYTYQRLAGAALKRDCLGSTWITASLWRSQNDIIFRCRAVFHLTGMSNFYKSNLKQIIKWWCLVSVTLAMRLPWFCCIESAKNIVVLVVLNRVECVLCRYFVVLLAPLLLGRGFSILSSWNLWSAYTYGVHKIAHV